MDDANTTLFLDEHAAAIGTAAKQQIRTAARRDIEALKAAIASQFAALEASSAGDEIDPGVDRAIAQLCEAAQVTIQITQAQLEGEIHNRMAVAAELQAVNQKLLQAKKEADALRLQLQRLDRTRPPQPVALSAESAADHVCAALERLGDALGALDRANVGTRLLTAVFDMAAEHFARVALCAPEGSGFVVWRSRGFEPALPRKTVLRLPAESPIARSAAEWIPAWSAAVDGQPAAGVMGGAVGYAMAVPIVEKGRGAAILYAENPPGSSPNENRVAAKMVEILAGYVRSRVQIKPATAGGDKGPYATQRRARRVKMTDGTTVVVDNSESTLVDLSSLGAQVVSRQAMRPDSPVHLVLPSDAGGIACVGRVVWVVVERQANLTAALYRAGVQFTDVKRGELEGFIDFFDSGIRH